MKCPPILTLCCSIVATAVVAQPPDQTPDLSVLVNTEAEINALESIIAAYEQDGEKANEGTARDSIDRNSQRLGRGHRNKSPKKSSNGSTKSSSKDEKSLAPEDLYAFLYELSGATKPGNVGQPGLLPPELVLAILVAVLTGASPADFDMKNQVCPQFEADKKAALDLMLMNTVGYQQFFNTQSILTGGGGTRAETPGLCTTSYISHKEIKDGIAALPHLQVNGEISRGNELGLFRLNNRTFEYCLDLLPEKEQDFCGIILGVPNADHETLRPFLDTLWGDGSAPGSMFTTQGDKWNKQEFLSSAKAFLDGKDELNLKNDATFWTIKELHNQTLGIKLPEDQIQAFQDLQGASLLLAILPASLVDDVATQLGTTVGAVNAGKLAFVGMYLSILTSMFPELSESSLDKLAMGLLDSFIFAGGASVPSTIKNGLAAYYNGLTPDDFDTKKPIDLGVLALETVRSYPPVLGVPYTHKATGQRLAPLPGMAGYDREVYGSDADDFRIRGDLSYYHKRSLNWADSALPVEGKPFSNHICPARSMSYSMITAFWEALDAAEWCVHPDTPIVKETGNTFWSDFKIIRRGTGACG